MQLVIAVQPNENAEIKETELIIFNRKVDGACGDGSTQSPPRVFKSWARRILGMVWIRGLLDREYGEHLYGMLGRNTRPMNEGEHESVY